MLWSLVHIWSLIGFRKRVFVFFSWLWSYFSYSPKARLITGEPEALLQEPRKLKSDKPE